MMSMIIDKPGIYDISEDVYHGDPCATPSFSSSFLKELLAKSPLHAFYKHPRLNTAFVPENKKAFDLGKAAHAALLGEGGEVVEVNFNDYRTKAAREARDEAYAEGKTPLLSYQARNVEAMVKSARRQLSYNEDGAYFLEAGHSEQSAFWQEDGVWCRARYDRIPLNRRFIYDYKTTSGSAHPDEFLRKIVNLGYDLSAAHYIEAERQIHGHEPNYFFVVQEIEEPYGLSVIALTPAFLELGRLKRNRAMSIGSWCLKNEKWFPYPNRACYVDPPAYDFRKWMDEEGDPLTSTQDEMKSLIKQWENFEAPISQKGEAA